MAGGTKGTHPAAKTHDFLVAPTDASETNAIRAGIIPVGCWRIDDVRFEFDSSIVLPDSSDEFAALDALRKEHPDCPLSIYGHADPVGNDTYNKKLSGRRAEAVYALLTRDVDRWEKLYSKPIDGTGDRWKYRAIQIMLAALGFDPGPPTGDLNGKTIKAVKAFQGENGLEDDGDPGPLTRAELFPQYMDKVCVDASGAAYTLAKDVFLAQGADPDGKGDFQGCGEFNPVMMFSKKENDEFKKASKKAQRDAENAPNRRVMALLYRKGSKVAPDRWPCPRAAEGPEGCEKRFFANADERRQFGADRRRFEETKDTFACRFYQRQTEHSPCESGAAPAVPLATLEFVLPKDAAKDFAIDASHPATTVVRMGLWDHAFKADASDKEDERVILANDAEEEKNFVGADSRRFYLRVKDTAASERVQVNWRTLKADGGDLDSPGVKSLTLVENPAGSKVFVSKALMLVADAADQAQKTNAGFASGDPDAGEAGPGAHNHRIRRGSMRGSVEAEYQPAAGPAVKATAKVFEGGPDARRKMPVQVFVMRVVPGGAGALPTDAASVIFTRDLRIMREVYERLNIEVETVTGPSVKASDIVTVGADKIVLIDPPSGMKPNNVDDDDEAKLGKLFPALADTMRLFYVAGLQSTNRGEAWPDGDFKGKTQVGAAFINGSSSGSGPFSPAHELGHILTDKSSSVNGGHYKAPKEARLPRGANLMRNRTSAVEGVGESKRLWDDADGDSLRQFTKVRGSHYTRPA